MTSRPRPLASTGRAAATATALAAVCFAALVALALAPRPGFAAGAGFSAADEATGTTTTTPEPTVTPEPTASVSTTHVVGHSVKGRAIRLERFGHGSGRRILILGGLHGDEAGGPVARAFVVYLRAHPSAVPSGTQVDVVSYANPDGRALNRRTNARKVDLNRNFPSKNWTRKHAKGTPSHGTSPGSEPETKALVKLLKARHYRRVLSLHSRGGIMDFNGKGSHRWAVRVAKAAHVRVYQLPGTYPGSMGHYVPEKIHIPIVTWELSSRTMTPRVRAGLLAWVK